MFLWSERGSSEPVIPDSDPLCSASNRRITSAIEMNNTEKENKSDEDSESLEEEEVDPRIQVQSDTIQNSHRQNHFNETRLNVVLTYMNM